MKKLRSKVLTAFALTFLGMAATLYIPFPGKRLSPRSVMSLRITDRKGMLLREVLSEKGGIGQWVNLREISPHLIKATIAAEDANFFFHSGVNPLSVLRAARQNLREGRVVSGASTISQQLVRNLYQHRRRNLPAKVHEAWMAIRLDRWISKETILEQYLNRISYGNQAAGIEAAARLYFDKPSSHLSLAESSFLAAIPRSPSFLNPYHNAPAVKKRQKDILIRMVNLKMIDAAMMTRALEDPLTLSPAGKNFKAPHFCDYILTVMSDEDQRRWDVVRTTLDLHLQEKIESLLADHLDGLQGKGISNGAVLVLDNESGDILSMVGSRDFFDEGHSGQVNGVLSPRQPGSALKPFTYALALEKGMTAATLLEDSEAAFETQDGWYFLPQNYDRKYHGPVSLRNALACSYNVPAVSLLQTLGPDLLYQRLKILSFDSLQKPPGFYGVGLTLGNGEVTLLELCRAYAALGRGGILKKERSVLEYSSKASGKRALIDVPAGDRVFSPDISYIISHILSDPDARVSSFGYQTPLRLPFPAAAKTGTTKDFRDNWTIGYSPRYTTGVWVGNFDGKAMHNVSGITGCGPLFRDVMLLLHQDRSADEFVRPANIVTASVCPASGFRLSSLCPGRIEEIFIRGTEPAETCAVPHGLKAEYRADVPSRIARENLSIIAPRDGDVFKLDPVLRQEFQAVTLKVLVPQGWDVREMEWWINGQKAGVSASPFSFSWTLKPGSYIIKAKMRKGRDTRESLPVRVLVLS